MAFPAENNLGKIFEHPKNINQELIVYILKYIRLNIETKQI